MSQSQHLFDIKDEFAANHSNLISILEEQKSSANPNKILIPSRVYVPKPETFIKLPSKNEEIANLEDDLWGNVKEKPKFTEIKEIPQGKQDSPAQEELIRIPVHHYKSQANWEEAKNDNRRPRAIRGTKNRGSRTRQYTNPNYSEDIWAEEGTTKEEPPIQPAKQEKQDKSPVSDWPNFVQEPVSVLEEFNIKTFKTQKCPSGEKCRGCVKFHYDGERRRDTEKFNYYPINCPRGSLCHLGDRCGKAHNFWELYYHPQIYKSEVCCRMSKLKNCIFGNLCNYLHFNENDRVRRLYCKGCGAESVGFIRNKCGHGFCRKCAEGDTCKVCMKVGDCIEIKD